MAIVLQKPSSYHNLFGIFVGVENFHHSKGQIGNLMHANEDADKMCALFLPAQKTTIRKHELSLLVDHGYQVAYRDAVSALEPTRANILRALTNYLKKAKADDLLLLYISTHGLIDYDDYFFMPCDGELDNVLGTGIASSTLIGAIGKVSARGVKALLILDTCHAGAVSFDISKYKGEFACLLSSSPVEYSYEFFKAEHGVFTEYLVKGLAGAAAQQGKPVTLIDLYDYVYRNVQQSTKKQQNPLLIGTMKYDTVLIDNEPASRLLNTEAAAR